MRQYEVRWTVFRPEGPVFWIGRDKLWAATEASAMWKMMRFVRRDLGLPPDFTIRIRKVRGL